MREIEMRAIEAVNMMMEGFSELTDILMTADNGDVDDAFNNSEAADLYPQIFCKSFTELDLCVWGEKLIKAISAKSHYKGRWKVKSYGGGEDAQVKFFPKESYDEALRYAVCMKEDHLVVKVYEYSQDEKEYKLAFSL